jgi:hypothetical protein
MDEAVLSDDGMVSDEGAWHDERPLAYRRAVANGLSLRFKGTKMAHDTQKGVERVGVQEQRLAFRTDHFFINKDYRRGRVESFGIVFRVVNEGDVSRLHLVDFVQAGNGEIGGTNVLGTNQFRNSFKGSFLDFHRKAILIKVQKYKKSAKSIDFALFYALTD